MSKYRKETYIQNNRGGKIVKINRFLSGSISILLCLALSLSLVSCSNNQETIPSDSSSSEDSSSRSTEPITIRVYNAMAATKPTRDNKIYKLIQDETGVKFDFEFLTGDAIKKADEMIENETYPDLLGLSGEQSGLQEFLDAGALIPLEEYINKYPNLKKHYGPIINQIKDPVSGHVYIMPNYGVTSGTYNSSETFGAAFWIQAAVLKEAGYPKIKTLDEWFEIIRKYMDKHPKINGQNTIGFEILVDKSKDWVLRNAPAQLSGHPNDGNVIVDNNVARIFAGLDVSKRYFKKLNEMYQAGVIDPEFSQMDFDTYISKISSGRVLGLYDQRWNFQLGYNSILAQEMYDRHYVPVPVTFDKETKDWYLNNPIINVNSGYGISVNCKDPERVMQLFDTLLEEKWQKILQWGIEGEDYMIDASGKFYRTPEQRDNSIREDWKLANKVEALLQFCPKLEGTYSDGNATEPALQPGEYYASLKDEQKEVLNAYKVETQGQLFSTPPENPVYFPCYTMTIPVGSEEQMTEQKLKEKAFKHLPKIISCNPGDFERLWKEYTDDINKENIAGLEKLYNDGIQERLIKWSKTK